MRRFLVLVLKDRKIVGYLTRDFLKVEELSFKCVHYGEKDLYNEIVVKRNSKYEYYNLLICPYEGILGDVFCKELHKNDFNPTIRQFDFEDEIIDSIIQSSKCECEESEEC